MNLKIDDRRSDLYRLRCQPKNLTPLFFPSLFFDSSDISWCDEATTEDHRREGHKEKEEITRGDGKGKEDKCRGPQ